MFVNWNIKTEANSNMFELYLDRINITKSKKKKKLVYKKHVWSDDYNIPMLILIFPILWISIKIYEGQSLSSDNVFIHIVALLLLFIGIITLYRNLLKIRKLETIETGVSKIINREIIVNISNELGIESHSNNKDVYIGVYKKSYPFKQIITIIYLKDKILFNARNACIGYNGMIGRPPFALNSAKKIFEIYRKEIETSCFLDTEYPST